jgi:hypothetical protein
MPRGFNPEATDISVIALNKIRDYFFSDDDKLKKSEINKSIHHFFTEGSNQ